MQHPRGYRGEVTRQWPITRLVQPSHAATLHQVRCNIALHSTEPLRAANGRAMARFNLASLFEPWTWTRNLRPYPSHDSILNAVSSGRKPIWRDDWLLANIEGGDPAFGKYLRKALERGLAVTLVQRDRKMPRERWCPEVYLLKLEETWRISALHALHETFWTRGSHWTPANEANKSVLLGYSAKQRSASSPRERRLRARTCTGVRSNRYSADRRRNAVSCARI